MHNFPERPPTYLTAPQDPKPGVAIAVTIALHNIPEGISVAVPIFYYATGNRKKSLTPLSRAGWPNLSGRGLPTWRYALWWG